MLDSGESDKRSSLLRSRISYGRKEFYNACPRVLKWGPHRQENKIGCYDNSQHPTGHPGRHDIQQNDTQQKDPKEIKYSNKWHKSILKHNGIQQSNTRQTCIQLDGTHHFIKMTLNRMMQWQKIYSIQTNEMKTNENITTRRMAFGRTIPSKKTFNRTVHNRLTLIKMSSSRMTLNRMTLNEITNRHATFKQMILK
jgi:hypothetical protein